MTLFRGVLVSSCMVLSLAAPWFSFAATQAGPSHPYFRIRVVDDQTSRGVPAVRLRTADDHEYWTDSAGVVAFYEPDLMNKDVFFAAETYGYSIAPDPSGHRGASLRTTPSGSGAIRLHRENIAQRLYRITGVNIYGDSILLGDTVPATQDPAAYPVTGQDSAVTAIYKNKLYWLWGDTGMSNYPLGNFKTTGATSELPGQGGLDPETGIYLTYFRQANQTVKPMVNIPFDGLIWSGDMRSVLNSLAEEILVGDYVEVEPPFTAAERGLMKFNDTAKRFDKVVAYPDDAIMLPGGVPLRYDDNGVSYFYYAAPWPNVRSPIDFDSLQNLATYEAFTCLKAGSRFDGTAGQLERDGNGDLVWGWKKNTSPMSETETKQLVSAGIIGTEDEWYQLEDINTGVRPQSHSGSVFWNEYRGRWISIMQQIWGTSLIGEVWYFEGDTPLGPWVYGQKIVTHAAADSTYSFYNVLQHPMFEKNGGRTIFFEGTYTEWLGNPDHPTPDYDYNQMMYKLELDDSRLFLPVPVYLVEGPIPFYRTKKDISESNTSRTTVCFAPDRPRVGTIPIYEYLDSVHNTVILRDNNASGTPNLTAFHAVSREATIPPGSDVSLTVPLNEFVNAATGARIYTTKDSIDNPGFQKSAQPVCRVWPNPIKFNPYRLRS